MNVWYIVAGVAVLILLIFLVLLSTKVCDGGELISGCGKNLYPWSKKMKLPSGIYCCPACYARDLQVYADRVKMDDTKLTFTELEEMFGELDEDTEDAKDT